MPTKENSSGRQQPYDESNGEYKSFNSFSSSNKVVKNYTLGEDYMGKQIMKLGKYGKSFNPANSTKYNTEEFLQKLEENKENINSLIEIANKDKYVKKDINNQLYEELGFKRYDDYVYFLDGIGNINVDRLKDEDTYLREKRLNDIVEELQVPQEILGHKFYIKKPKGETDYELFIDDDDSSINSYSGYSPSFYAKDMEKSIDILKNSEYAKNVLKDYKTLEDIDLNAMNKLKQNGFAIFGMLDKTNIDDLQEEYAKQNDGMHFSIDYEMGEGFVINKISKEQWEAEKKKKQEQLQQKEREKVIIQHKKDVSNKIDNAKSIDDILQLDREDIFNYLSDKSLYENESFDSSNGGYKGQSKSNRAIRAEQNGQFPKSKWNKAKVNEVLENEYFSGNDYIDDFVKSAISKMSDKEIKENLIEQASWHHTGSFYNKTNYWGLKSPQYIMSYVLDNPKTFKTFKKGSK